jgi:hypothetical protein
MANTSEIFSDVSSEVDACSALLSAVEIEADVGSVVTSRTTQTSRLTSSIHKHCRTTIKEEKERTKKAYFCKYCPPQDPKGYHASTIGLQHHLRKHDIEWSTEENNRRNLIPNSDLRSSCLYILAKAFPRCDVLSHLYRVPRNFCVQNDRGMHQVLHRVSRVKQDSKWHRQYICSLVA